MASKIIRIALIAVFLSGLAVLVFKAPHWQEQARQAAERPQTKYVENSNAVIAGLEITDLQGKVAKLPGTGRYRLINYWATWCGPCLMEMPILKKFAQSQGSSGVMVIGIALDEAEDVSRYLKENPVNYPQFLEIASEHDSSAQLGNTSGIIPFSVLIGPDGRLLKVKRGEFSDQDDLARFAKAPKP